MKKAFDEGWGAVIAKTVSLDSSKVSNLKNIPFTCRQQCCVLRGHAADIAEAEV